MYLGDFYSVTLKLVGRIGSGAVRIVTDKSGIPQAWASIHEKRQEILMQWAGGKSRVVALLPNEKIAWKG